MQPFSRSDFYDSSTFSSHKIVPVVAGFVSRKKVFKPILVALPEVVPHGLIGVVAPVVLAQFPFACVAVPDVAGRGSRVCPRR
jgi:hypothetical protein